MGGKVAETEAMRRDRRLLRLTAGEILQLCEGDARHTTDDDERRVRINIDGLVHHFLYPQLNSTLYFCNIYEYLLGESLFLFFYHTRR